MSTDAALIRVHSHWDDWRNADVRLGDLRDFHWLQPTRAPHSLVHAYVSCLDIVAGDIPHECDRRSAPHRLLVCILKRHTIPIVYAELSRRADERQAVPADQHAVYGDYNLDPRSVGFQADGVVVRVVHSTALLTNAERASRRLHTESGTAVSSVLEDRFKRELTSRTSP